MTGVVLSWHIVLTSDRSPSTGRLEVHRLIDEPRYPIVRRLSTETKYAIDSAPRNDSTVASPRAHPVENTSIRRTTMSVATGPMNSRRGSYSGDRHRSPAGGVNMRPRTADTMSRQEQDVDDSFAERIDRIIDREWTVLDRLAD